MDDLTMAIKRLLVSSGIALSLGGCSSLVSADRSKIPDTLYQPSPTADGGGETDGAATDAGEANDGGAPDDAVSGDSSANDSLANDSGADAGSGGDAAIGQ
jgi:hypothetical protein